MPFLALGFWRGVDEVTRVRGQRISEKALDCLEGNSRETLGTTLGEKPKSESLGTGFLVLTNLVILCPG